MLSRIDVGVEPKVVGPSREGLASALQLHEPEELLTLRGLGCFFGSDLAACECIGIEARENGLRVGGELLLDRCLVLFRGQVLAEQDCGAEKQSM